VIFSDQVRRLHLCRRAGLARKRATAPLSRWDIDYPMAQTAIELRNTSQRMPLPYDFRRTEGVA
jgi:hypothetical protein